MKKSQQDSLTGKEGFLSTEDEYDERFASVFEDFFAQQEALDKAWFESDRQKKMEAELQKFLEEHGTNIFEEKHLVQGIFLGLHYLSQKQMEALEKFLHRSEKITVEGVPEKKDQKIFERKGSGPETRSPGPDSTLLFLQRFDALLKKFYAILGRLAEKKKSETEMKAYLRVAWSVLQECAQEIRKANKKNPTEVELQILQFEHQLDAMDPDHPFMGQVRT